MIDEYFMEMVMLMEMFMKMKCSVPHEYVIN